MDHTITRNFNSFHFPTSGSKDPKKSRYKSLFTRMECNPIAQELPLLALMRAFVRFVGNDGKNEAPVSFTQENNFAHVAHVLVLW